MPTRLPPCAATIFIVALTSLLPAQTSVTNKEERAGKLRTVLLDAMEQSYANDGQWPATFGGDPTAWTYRRPEPFVDPASIAPLVTVVAHEGLESHPDGIWVGYADGHLEFARDAAALRECINQNSMIEASNARAKELREIPEDRTLASGKLVLRVVDESGKPVEGAQVGVFTAFDGKQSEDDPAVYFRSATDGAKRVTTDAQGQAVLDAELVYQPPYRHSISTIAPIYVLHESRQLAGLDQVTRTEFSTERPVEKVIVASPACRVRGTLLNVGVDTEPTRAHVMAFKTGEFALRPIYSNRESNEFEFFLPPGQYEMSADLQNTYGMYRMFRISPGETERVFELNVEPTATAQLIGKPAPELRKIKGWKNTQPVSLAELRGRVVLLDFWGYWCGPCIGSMPELMKLHDELGPAGLVIVGVHDDSVESIDQMDLELAKVKKELWADRDLPFAIALDGGGETRVHGSTLRVRGATTAAYGINAFPTNLLVDREGIVHGPVNIHNPDDLARLRAMVTAAP